MTGRRRPATDEMRRMRESLRRIETDVQRVADTQARDQILLASLPERMARIETMISHERDRRNYRRAVIAAVLSGALGSITTALITLL